LEQDDSISEDDEDEDASAQFSDPAPVLYRIRPPSDSIEDLAFSEDEEDGPYGLAIMGHGAEAGIGVGDLNRGMLSAYGCYILDVGVEMFLWLGLEADKDIKRIAAEKMAVSLLSF
jgi:hypothetical protein